MDKRCASRYDSSLLPKELTKAYLISNTGVLIESSVVNISGCGIKTDISLSCNHLSIPQRNETFKVALSSKIIGLSGICVYSDVASAYNMSIGIYFYYPNEQHKLYKMLSEILPFDSDHDPESKDVEKRFIKHEWEERVRMLCDSENPRMRSIGLQELEVINREYRS
jgi:hypothetical protein